MLSTDVEAGLGLRRFHGRGGYSTGHAFESQIVSRCPMQAYPEARVFTMNSAQILTLFAEPQFPTRSYSLLASILVHGTGGVVISIGMLRNPPVIQASLHSNLVHVVRLSASMDAQLAARAYTPPLSWSDLEPVPERDWRKESEVSAKVSRTRQTQVLLQADTSVVQIRDEVAPSLMIVAARPVNISLIEEPSHPDAGSAAVRPKLELPNGEAHVEEINVTSSPSATEKSTVLPSSTTPIAIGSSNQVLPGLSSEFNQHAALARMVSISDQQLVSGSVVLPEVSIVPARVSFENGEQDQSSAARAGHARAEDSAQGIGNGNGSNVSGKRISLPKNGHFPVVLIGDSIQEAYPETAGTWRGRLAYTVYLPIDAGKRWILQYSLSSASQPAGAMSAARPQAPWPVDMLVPNLDAYLSGLGAVIVHGVISPEGRFDDLAVAFPPQFPEEAALLDALKKWVFRPGFQRGRPVELEMLLIIPEAE